MYIEYMKDCCKEREEDEFSHPVDWSRENGFKTQQERLENKNYKDGEEGWLGGCAACNLRLFEKSRAP